jgi:hypothetical protein
MEPPSVVSTTVEILSLFSNKTGSVGLNRLKIRPPPSRLPHAGDVALDGPGDLRIFGVGDRADASGRLALYRHLL